MASLILKNTVNDIDHSVRVIEMDDHDDEIYKCSTIIIHHNKRSIWRRPLRMKKKKKKVQTVRLGGKRKQLLVKIYRRIRTNWMRIKKACTLKKLKEYYYSVLKDIIAAGGTFETFQQRLMLESSFAVPVMGLQFNTFH